MNNLSNLQIEGINEVNRNLSESISNLSRQDNLSNDQIQMIYSALQIIEKGYTIQSNIVKGET